MTRRSICCCSVRPACQRRARGVAAAVPLADLAGAVPGLVPTRLETMPSVPHAFTGAVRSRRVSGSRIRRPGAGRCPAGPQSAAPTRGAPLVVQMPVLTAPTVMTGDAGAGRPQSTATVDTSRCARSRVRSLNRAGAGVPRALATLNVSERRMRLYRHRRGPVPAPIPASRRSRCPSTRRCGCRRRLRAGGDRSLAHLIRRWAPHVVDEQVGIGAVAVAVEIALAGPARLLAAGNATRPSPGASSAVDS